MSLHASVQFLDPLEERINTLKHTGETFMTHAEQNQLSYAIMDDRQGPQLALLKNARECYARILARRFRDHRLELDDYRQRLEITGISQEDAAVLLGEYEAKPIEY